MFRDNLEAEARQADPCYMQWGYDAARRSYFIDFYFLDSSVAEAAAYYFGHGGAYAYPGLASWLETRFSERTLRWGETLAPESRHGIMQPNSTLTPNQLGKEGKNPTPCYTVGINFTLAKDLVAESGYRNDDELLRYELLPAFTAYLCGQQDGIFKTPAFLQAINRGMDSAMIEPRLLARLHEEETWFYHYEARGKQGRARRHSMPQPGAALEDDRPHLRGGETSGFLNEHREDDGGVDGFHFFEYEMRTLGEILIDWQLYWHEHLRVDASQSFLAYLGLEGLVTEEQFNDLRLGNADLDFWLTQRLARLVPPQVCSKAKLLHAAERVKLEHDDAMEDRPHLAQAWAGTVTLGEEAYKQLLTMLPIPATQQNSNRPKAFVQVGSPLAPATPAVAYPLAPPQPYQPSPFYQLLMQRLKTVSAMFGQPQFDKSFALSNFSRFTGYDPWVLQGFLPLPSSIPPKEAALELANLLFFDDEAQHALCCRLAEQQFTQVKALDVLGGMNHGHPKSRGEILRLLRQNFGLSPEDFSALIGTSYQGDKDSFSPHRLVRWELDKAPPTVDILASMALAMKELDANALPIFARLYHILPEERKEFLEIVEAVARGEQNPVRQKFWDTKMVRARTPLEYIESACNRMGLEIGDFCTRLGMQEQGKPYYDTLLNGWRRKTMYPKPSQIEAAAVVLQLSPQERARLLTLWVEDSPGLQEKEKRVVLEAMLSQNADSAHFLYWSTRLQNAESLLQLIDMGHECIGISWIAFAQQVGMRERGSPYSENLWDDWRKGSTYPTPAQLDALMEVLEFGDGTKNLCSALWVYDHPHLTDAQKYDYYKVLEANPEQGVHRRLWQHLADTAGALGERIYALRNRERLTQNALAGQIGASEATLNNYEKIGNTESPPRKNSFPTPEHIEALTRALHLDTKDQYRLTLAWLDAHKEHEGQDNRETARRLITTGEGDLHHRYWTLRAEQAPTLGRFLQALRMRESLSTEALGVQVGEALRGQAFSKMWFSSFEMERSIPTEQQSPLIAEALEMEPAMKHLFRLHLERARHMEDTGRSFLPGEGDGGLTPYPAR